MVSEHIQVKAFRTLASGLSLLGDAHVWLMFKKDLRQPLQPFRPRVPCIIEQAFASDMFELAQVDNDDDEEQVAELAAGYRSRFSMGAHCFVARVEGRIVAYDWLRLRAAVGAADVPMLLKDDEVYGSDAYTAEGWRGQGIHPALNYSMLKYAQDQGYATVYSQARADNAQSLPTLRRLKWALTALMLVFEPKWAPHKAMWLVRGSPYPMPVGALASTRLPTLAEYFQKHPFEERELVKSSPWSRTYSLRSGTSRCYLKTVPREQVAGLRAAEAVARACPGDVPAVIASNHVFESWQLTQDHGGTVLGAASSHVQQLQQSQQSQLLQMVQTYANLQVRSTANHALLEQLPPTPVEGLVKSLLQFLGTDAKAHSPEPAAADRFLGAAQARRCFEAISHAKALLEAHLAPATELPVTLNHGHLRPDHAVLTPSGKCLLINWTRAASGPAGLSLHSLLGAQVAGAVSAALRGGTQGGAQGGANGAPPADPLLSHYVETLARGGYAEQATLNRCLPAAMTVGFMLDVLFLAGCVMDDPDESAMVSERLRTQLNHLVELCDLLSASSGPFG
jgi:hypothetical protein